MKAIRGKKGENHDQREKKKRLPRMIMMSTGTLISGWPVLARVGCQF